MEKIKVVKNAAWLVGIQVLRAVISLVISILTARYLGPSDLRRFDSSVCYPCDVFGLKRGFGARIGSDS